MRRAKRWLPLLLAMLLLSACGNTAGLEASSSAAAQSPGGTVPPASVTFQAVDVKSETVPLTEEEVLAAYDRAAAAFGWFKLKTLPCGDASVIVEGNLYQRVDYAGIGTLEELKTYLRGSFSQEVIDRLLPEDAGTPLYRDIDGQLYVLPFSHQPDPHKGTAVVMVEQSAEDTYMVNVTVDILAEDLQTVTGLEGYSFPYQYVDGRWIFTSFQLVNAPA